MEKYIDDLTQTNLFNGIKPEEIANLLNCFHARCIEYSKGDLIIEDGSMVYDFGIMLSGHGRSIKLDSTGRLIIISLLKKGSEIGIILAASLNHKSPVSVEAQDDVKVLQISFERIFTRCERACLQHEKLLRNYINIVAEKGLVLHERINCLLQPSVRDKILTYLLRVSHEKESQVFSIPLDRKAMAEYLNIDRSVLSNELSKMQHDGLIDYYKNNFKILKNN